MPLLLFAAFDPAFGTEAREESWVEARPSPMMAAATPRRSQALAVYEAYAQLADGAAHEELAIGAWTLYAEVVAPLQRAPSPLSEAYSYFTMVLVISDTELGEAEAIYASVEHAARELAGDGVGRGELRRREADALWKDIERDRSWVAAVCTVQRSSCPEPSQLEDALGDEIAALRGRVAQHRDGIDAWDVERLARLLRVRATMRRIDLEDRGERLLFDVVGADVEASIWRTVRR